MQHIEGDDLVASCPGRGHDMTADEAGGAGDENPHAAQATTAADVPPDVFADRKTSSAARNGVGPGRTPSVAS